MNEFVVLICELMKNNKNHYVRNLLVSWFETLDSIPNISILNCVSMILPFLIIFVADRDVDVKTKSEKRLSEFLTELAALGDKREAQMDQEILKSLLDFSQHEEFHHSARCRSVALDWTRSLLTFLGVDIKRGSKVHPSI